MGAWPGRQAQRSITDDSSTGLPGEAGEWEMGAGCESLSPACMWPDSMDSLRGTKPIKKDALHIPRALGLHPAQTAGAIPMALWSWTEFMGLCGEEMISTEPIRNKRNWNHYKGKQSEWNCIVWGFFQRFFCLEREGGRDQTCVFNTNLEYEFHGRKMLWNRLGSDFHIGPFFPPNNPIECKKDLQNPVTRLIEWIRFVITSCRVLKENKTI